MYQNVPKQLRLDTYLDELHLKLASKISFTEPNLVTAGSPESGQSVHCPQRDLERHDPDLVVARPHLLLLGVHQALVIGQAHLLLPRGHLFVAGQLLVDDRGVEEGHQAHFGGREVVRRSLEFHENILYKSLKQVEL